MSIDDRDWRREELRQKRQADRLLSRVDLSKPGNSKSYGFFIYFFLFVAVTSAVVFLKRFLF